MLAVLSEKELPLFIPLSIHSGMKSGTHSVSSFLPSFILAKEKKEKVSFAFNGIATTHAGNTSDAGRTSTLSHSQSTRNSRLFEAWYVTILPFNSANDRDCTPNPINRWHDYWLSLLVTQRSGYPPFDLGNHTEEWWLFLLHCLQRERINQLQELKERNIAVSMHNTRSLIEYATEQLLNKKQESAAGSEQTGNSPASSLRLQMLQYDQIGFILSPRPGSFYCNECPGKFCPW